MPSALQLYKKELARCRENFGRVDLQKEKGYLMKYTTFSANVENVIPSIPRSKHEELFHESLLQQLLVPFDQKCLTAGDLIKLRGADQIRPDEPRIYCAYHLGSYRLITSTLFRQGVDCVLMVGSGVNYEQSDDMLEHIEGLRQKHGYTNSFRIVDAGSPAVGLTVLRELKSGKSLIIFVDGSFETAPKPGEEDKFISVRLGNRRMLTRKGVGYLSHAAGVPIVPIISYRLPDFTNVITCLNPIKPIRDSNREIYSQEAVQQLYDVFWPYLNRYPSQWEGWNYVHSFLEPEKHKNEFLERTLARPVFNENRYTLCDLEQAPILFDRRLYQTYEITEDLRDLLLNINAVDSVEDLVGREMFGELVEMEILC